MSSLPLGNTTDLTGFSPADFGDARDMRPLEVQFDPTGLGSLTPYSTLVTNVIQRQLVEVRDKTVNPSPLPLQWKKRFREFFVSKNEDLVEFLKKPLQSSSALYKSDIFLRKFGRPDFQATHPSLHQTFLDVSGFSGMSSIEAEILKIGPSKPKEILDQVRWVYDMYREAGEECLKQENLLKLRLDIFDKTYQKVIGICELPSNESSQILGEAVESYVRRLFEENQIEQQYTATVEAYRRFAALKELVGFFRFTDLQEKEPLCSICMTDTVSFAISPCGHTFCSTCMKRQVSSCYMCRTPIRDRLKIFFG